MCSSTVSVLAGISFFLRLVLDHLKARAFPRLRQLHAGDELFDDVLPGHVLDDTHPLVNFRHELHLH